MVNFPYPKSGDDMFPLFKDHPDSQRAILHRLCFDLMGIKSRREKNIADALDFATSQGRMKYTRPLFKAVKGVVRGSVQSEAKA